MEVLIFIEGFFYVGGWGVDDNIGSIMLIYVDVMDYEDYVVVEI